MSRLGRASVSNVRNYGITEQYVHSSTTGCSACVDSIPSPRLLLLTCLISRMSLSGALGAAPRCYRRHCYEAIFRLLRGPFGNTSGISSSSATGTNRTDTSNCNAFAKRSMLSMVQFLTSLSTSLTKVLLNPASAANCSCERSCETRYARRFLANRVRKGFVLLVFDI